MTEVSDHAETISWHLVASRGISWHLVSEARPTRLASPLTARTAPSNGSLRHSTRVDGVAAPCAQLAVDVT